MLENPHTPRDLATTRFDSPRLFQHRRPASRTAGAFGHCQAQLRLFRLLELGALRIAGLVGGEAHAAAVATWDPVRRVAG